MVMCLWLRFFGAPCICDVLGERGEVFAEVVHGAGGEAERVGECGVGETLWCRRHDVLVHAVAVVAVAVMLRAKTAHAQTTRNV